MPLEEYVEILNTSKESGGSEEAAVMPKKYPVGSDILSLLKQGLSSIKT